jgi:hypothetical protein
MTNCLVYALDNNLTCSRQEVDLTQNLPAEGGAARRSTQSNVSNDVALSTDTSSAATNATSSTRSSAKITGLESGQLSKISIISLQEIMSGKRALKPVQNRDATSTPSDTGPIDWRPPRSPSDSESSNGPQACGLSTERFTSSPPIIPRITIRGCENKALEIKALEIKADMLEESSCSDIDVSKSSRNSDRSSEDRNGSTKSTTSQLSWLQPERTKDSPAAQVYMPYRPWYCTPESRSPVANKLHNVTSQDDTVAPNELHNEQSKVGPADEATLKIAMNVFHAEPPSTVRCEDAKLEPRSVMSRMTETARVVPLMPARPPPRPPITRNKHKPLPPPRRRLLRDVNPFLSAEEGLSLTSMLPAPTQVVSTVGPPADTDNTPPLLVSLQDVLDRSFAIRQRASTGDLAIGATHTHSKAKYRRDCSIQRLRHPNLDVDMRLSRPASKPDLKDFGCRPTIPSAVSGLEVQGPSHPAENHATIRFNDERCDIRELLQDQRAVETKRIRDICESWNCRQWAKAESYLTYHLSTLEVSANSECARRTRHLLGVCASYRGHWQRTLNLFISVLRTPVEATRKLDDGDRAAFYWLADTYALLGRGREALLAYCLAGSCG